MNKEALLNSLEEKKFPQKILDAFSNVKREDFLPRNVQSMAYEDSALPIGYGQTISQPQTIAIMLSLLDPKVGNKVLEIGSGSGYVLALLSNIVGREGSVYGVEVVKQLVKRARDNLFEDHNHVKVFNKNGSDGLPDEAPFDRIIVSAALRDIPEKLLEQLKVGGILVAPKGSRFEQEIVAIKRKSKAEFELIKNVPGFIFVPFVEN